MSEYDTIAAIATGLTVSGIGKVRVSGDQAIPICNRIFHGADLLSAPTHTVHYGMIVDGDDTIDEVLVLVLRAPRTYTREDTVEIDCHGSPLLLRRVLEATIHAGARVAEPGEFTKRAFLHGRIDLTEAESVIELIEAKNDYARKSSFQRLRGALKDKLTELRAILLNRLAYIEAALDDPEHYDLSDFPVELREDVSSVRREIETLLDASENGRLLSEGIRTVIVGKPNAGKSSLLNLLLGEDRAIVTEVAGTTRDTLEAQINLGNILLNIVDTAGIRETSDVVERLGVERSKEAIADADLILFVLDSATALSEEDFEIIELLSEKQVIALRNKSDLPEVLSERQVRDLFSDAKVPVLSISSISGDGLERLQETIENVFFSGNVSYNDEILVTSVRQKTALANAAKSLSLVLQSIEDGMPEDILTIDLMDAYTELGKILGVSLGEDLVNEIFEKFCMGK